MILVAKLTDVYLISVLQGGMLGIYHIKIPQELFGGVFFE
jgi:hypothetical protein